MSRNASLKRWNLNRVWNVVKEQAVLVFRKKRIWGSGERKFKGQYPTLCGKGMMILTHFWHVHNYSHCILCSYWRPRPLKWMYAYSRVWSGNCYNCIKLNPWYQFRSLKLIFSFKSTRQFIFWLISYNFLIRF